MEGDTDDPAVLALRKQLMKNYACYLLFCVGDADDPRRRRVRALAARQQQRLLPGQRDQLVRLDRGCRGTTISSSSSARRSRSRGASRSCSTGSSSSARISTTIGVPDLTWFAPDLGRPKWDDANVRTLCYQLDASEDGADLGVDRLFFILNAHFESQWVKLPPAWVRPRLASRHRHEPTRRRRFRRAWPGDFHRSGRSLHCQPAEHGGAARPEAWARTAVWSDRVVGAARHGPSGMKPTAAAGGAR